MANPLQSHAEASEEIWEALLALRRKVDEVSEDPVAKENVQLKNEVTELQKENLDLKRKVTEMESELSWLRTKFKIQRPSVTSDEIDDTILSSTQITPTQKRKYVDPMSSHTPTPTSSPLKYKSQKSMELNFGDAAVIRLPEPMSLSQESTVSDSQGDEEWEMKEIFDLSTNPMRKAAWWPEDFIVNPEVNFGLTQPFKMRKMDISLAPKPLQIQFKYQRKYLQEEALKDFNRLAGPTAESKIERIDSDVKSPEQALSNPEIDPVFKYELNRTNVSKYRSILGSIDTSKVKLWLELTDSPPGAERSSFPTTQEAEEDKKIALKRSRLTALQRLFQAVYMVQLKGEAYVQVGKFLFRDERFNEAVRTDNYTLDGSIFHDSAKV